MKSGYWRNACFVVSSLALGSFALTACEVPINFTIVSATAPSDSASSPGASDTPDGGTPTPTPTVTPTATPTEAPDAFAVTLEAENMPTRTSGRAIDGGWALLSDGYVEQSVDFPTSGNYVFNLVARATSAQGVWAQAELRIDQVPVASTTVTSTDFAVFPMTVPVQAGSHRVAIAFTNDYYDAGAGVDRNLYIDRIDIAQGGSGTSGTDGIGDGSGGGATAAQGWPEMPSGMQPLFVDPMNGPMEQLHMMGNSDHYHYVPDSSEPEADPGNVLEFLFPQGFPGTGIAPASGWIPVNQGREIFIGFTWKVNADWQQHSAGFSKVLYLVHCSYCSKTGNRIADVMMMQGRVGGPYHLMMNEEVFNTNMIQPNRGDGTVVPGNWYRVGIYVKSSSSAGASDGVIRYWINGNLVGEYLNYPAPAQTFEEIHIDPVWGGVDTSGLVKAHDDFMRYGEFDIYTK